MARLERMLLIFHLKWAEHRNAYSSNFVLMFRKKKDIFNYTVLHKILKKKRFSAIFLFKLNCSGSPEEDKYDSGK